jgi:uncharacterized membrane protein
MAPSIIEYSLVGVSSFLLIIYHIWFIFNLLNKPENTTTGLTIFIRNQWVRDTRKKSGGDILAVQTLRNWILVSTFLASIAITIAFTTLTISSNMHFTDATINSNDQILDLNLDLLGLKSLIVVCCNFISFFSFTQSIRYFNHVGFAIQINYQDPSLDLETNFAESNVMLMLNRGAFFFTIAIRGFYFAIPFVFWFYNCYAMFGATIILLVTVYSTDMGMANRPTGSVPIRD